MHLPWNQYHVGPVKIVHGCNGGNSVGADLDCPKTINSRSHRSPRQLRLIPRLSPVEPACFWLVVVYFFVVWRLPAYSLTSLGMSPSSTYLSSSPSSPSLLSSCSPIVLARSCGLSHPPSVTPACFWLVVARKKIKRQPSKAFIVFYFCNFFSLFNSPPQNMKNTPPLHSTPAAHPLHHPSYRCCQLLVDCCVLGPNGGHVRQRTRPPPLFLMHLHLSS